MSAEIPLKLFTLAVFGLFAVTSNNAQEPGGKITEVVDSNPKPCLVVTGGVKSPTRFELRRPVRLAEALFFAGGLTESADGLVQVVHSSTRCFQSESRYPTEKDFPAPMKPETFQISALMRGEDKANPLLNAGDVVIVNEFSPVFVVGNVKQQREITLRQGLTLTKAIELAGGLLANSRTNGVRVYRMQNGKIGAADMTIDLNAIKKGRLPDLPLQPYDIIEIRNKKARPPHPGGPVLGVAPPGLAAGIIE